MHLAALAVLAGARLEVLLIAIIDQGVEALDRFDPDVAALAAVAAVGAAIGNELLTTEGHAAGATVAGANVNLALVEEFHNGGSMNENEHKINDPVLK